MLAKRRPDGSTALSWQSMDSGPPRIGAGVVVGTVQTHGQDGVRLVRSRGRLVLLWTYRDASASVPILCTSTSTPQAGPWPALKRLRKPHTSNSFNDWSMVEATPEAIVLPYTSGDDVNSVLVSRDGGQSFSEAVLPAPAELQRINWPALASSGGRFYYGVLHWDDFKLTSTRVGLYHSADALRWEKLATVPMLPALLRGLWIRVVGNRLLCVQLSMHEGLLALSLPLGKGQRESEVH
jgi:hypothetical protein